MDIKNHKQKGYGHIFALIDASRDKLISIEKTNNSVPDRIQEILRNKKPLKTYFAIGTSDYDILHYVFARVELLDEYKDGLNNFFIKHYDLLLYRKYSKDTNYSSNSEPQYANLFPNGEDLSEQYIKTINSKKELRDVTINILNSLKIAKMKDIINLINKKYNIRKGITIDSNRLSNYLRGHGEKSGTGENATYYLKKFSK